MIARRVLVVVLLAACACTTRVAEPARERPGDLCRSCFWDYQPGGLRAELIEVYGERRFDDPFAEGERRLLLATVTEDGAALCEARRSFEAVSGAAADPGRALLASETLAFTAARCGADPARAFRAAAAKARGASASWKASVYAAIAEGRFEPVFGEAAIQKARSLPYETTSFVLGNSRIVVPSGARVGAQVERTVRDWLSYQLSWDGADRPVGRSSLLEWHEGARLRDLLDAAEAKVFPLTGTIVARRGERWLAPDGDGVFRYEVLEDKVQYPTTLVAGDVGLVIDTHGISALVEPARREGVTLVVGCGDTPDKMKAAFDLARGGVNVWFPCDRFVGDVLGYDAPGVLIGSAPVRREGTSAVIGDRPVAFDALEMFVVEDFEGQGVARYYDAPARYFRALAADFPLRVVYVPVDGGGQSRRVIDAAGRLGAEAIGVRVETEADAVPVRAWLAASPRHRAVLFHTAPYPAGYALFDAFPGQTTFGDPTPIARVSSP